MKDLSISTFAFDVTVIGVVVDIFNHVPVAYVGSNPGNVHVEDKMKLLISYLCLLDEVPIRSIFESVLCKIDASSSRDLVDTREIFSSAFTLVDDVTGFDTSKLAHLMDDGERALRLYDEVDINLDFTSADSWNSFTKQIAEAVFFLFLSTVTTIAAMDTRRRALRMIERILYSKNLIHVKTICALMCTVIERRNTECLIIEKLLESFSDMDLILHTMSDPQLIVALAMAGIRNNRFKSEEKTFLLSILNTLDSLLQHTLGHSAFMDECSWVSVIQSLTTFSCIVIESGLSPRILNTFLNKLEVLCPAFVFSY